MVSETDFVFKTGFFDDPSNHEAKFLLFGTSPGACTIKLFKAQFTDFRNKLEYLSLASLSCLVLIFVVRLGVYPRVERLKYASHW
jgi:hypothetical protein